jgi:hypothetical protein
MALSRRSDIHAGNDDLERYAKGELSPSQVPAVVAHLGECPKCTDKLRKIKTVLVRPPAKRRDRRRESRVSVNEPASMRQLSPQLNVRWEVLILDVSKNGMRLEAPERLEPGTVVQIRLSKSSSIITAEVRYCLSVGDAFGVGVEIQDVFPIGSRIL